VRKLLGQYLARYRVSIVVVLALLLAQALTNLYLPALNADIINNGVAKGDTAYIINIGIVMLVVTAILGVCSLATVYLSAKIAMGFGRDVRLAVFRQVGTFSQVEMNKFGIPSLITRRRDPRAPAGRSAVSAARRDPADHVRLHLLHHAPRRAAFSGTPGQDRPDKPGHA